LFTADTGGRTSVSLGLADAIGDLRSTLRARTVQGADTGDRACDGDVVQPFGPANRPGQERLRRWTGLPSADELISALETRAIWAKFGF